MQNIYLLSDYKGVFGSKHSAFPYRSGMDRELLRKYFEDKGYTAKFLSFCDVDPANTSFKGQYVLYTSSEDKDYHYKSYIEDICYALQLQGAIVIPEYKYLRANNNKVFMELLRDLCDLQVIKNLKARHFGTLEELKDTITNISKGHLYDYRVLVRYKNGKKYSITTGNRCIGLLEYI